MRSISAWGYALRADAIRGQALRFIITGGLNTLLTYGVYIVFLSWTSYRVAYSVSFATGIAISLVLNGKWVHRSVITPRATVWFIVIYGLQYLLGLILLRVFIEVIGIPKQFASLAVLACCVPITFILTRFVFVRPTKEA